MKYTYEKDFDTRDHSELYLMKIVSTLNNEEFKALAKELRDLGGYYSKFKKGFIFREDKLDEISRKYPQEMLSKQEIEILKNVSIEDYCNQNSIELTGNGRWRSLKEHDSCVIDVENNHFFWNSRQRNGDIINFIEEYYNLSFRQACDLLGAKREAPYRIIVHREDIDLEEKKDISRLPGELRETEELRHLYAYLKKERKIEYSTIQEFIDRGLIKEDDRRNIIFKTFQENDPNKELIALSKKGTRSNQNYTYISPNSENVGFRFPVSEKPKTLYIYEAPIDLMSHYEMNKEKLQKEEALLVAMCGLKPNCVLKNLSEYDVEKIVLCVDNDRGGHEFTENLKQAINEVPVEVLLPEKKDWNEDIKEKKYQMEQAQMKEHFEKIKEQARAILCDPVLLKEYTEFAKKFNNYTLHNLLFLHQQNPDAQFVRSRRAFRKDGLSIRKEEIHKALNVFAPVIKQYFFDEKNKFKPLSLATEKEKELIEKKKIKLHTKTEFKTVPVYDITQTNAQKKDYPRILHKEKDLLSENSKLDPDRTLISMVNALRREGYQVDVENLSNPDLRIGKKGYTNAEDRIVLNMYDTPESKLKTLFHEYAHCILHKDLKDRNDTICEFEAETSSYLALQKYGIVSKVDSPLYIQTYGESIFELLDQNVNDREFSSIDILKNIQSCEEKMSEFFKKNMVLKEVADYNPETEKVEIGKIYACVFNQDNKPDRLIASADFKQGGIEKVYEKAKELFEKNQHTELFCLKDGELFFDSPSKRNFQENKETYAKNMLNGLYRVPPGEVRSTLSNLSDRYHLDLEKLYDSMKIEHKEQAQLFSMKL